MYLQSLRALCIAIVVVGIAWAVTLPFEAALEAVNQAAGRLSGGWAPWAVRQFTQLFEWWAIAGLAVLAIRVSSRLFRRSWWCVLTLVAFVLVLAGTVLSGRLSASETSYPALPDGPLRSDIVAIADNIGVGLSDVQLVPQTPTTTTYNAYVTGVGDHHVVVLYETLLLRSTRAEVGVVIAHELGHVVEQDSDRRAVLASLGAALVTAFVGAAATSSAVRRRARTQTLRISDAPAVPMLIALAMAGGVLVVPALNAASQAFELRADMTALDATGDPESLATVVRRAAALDLQNPHPGWLTRATAVHPSPAERIALSDAWAEAHD
jgi:STE24 endopeptidase